MFPGTWDVALFGKKKKYFVDVLQDLKMRSSRIRVALKAMPGIMREDKGQKTCTPRRSRHGERGSSVSIGQQVTEIGSSYPKLG